MSWVLWVLFIEYFEHLSSCLKFLFNPLIHPLLTKESGSIGTHLTYFLSITYTSFFESFFDPPLSSKASLTHENSSLFKVYSLVFFLELTFSSNRKLESACTLSPLTKVSYGNKKLIIWYMVASCMVFGMW